MKKALITKQRLLDTINLALSHDFKHKNTECRVDDIRQSERTDGNWEAVGFGDFNTDIVQSEECNDLRKEILEVLAAKYEVIWDK